MKKLGLLWKKVASAFGLYQARHRCIAFRNELSTNLNRLDFSQETHNPIPKGRRELPQRL
jgi:hypothetical protein